MKENSKFKVLLGLIITSSCFILYFIFIPSSLFLMLFKHHSLTKLPEIHILKVHPSSTKEYRVPNNNNTYSSNPLCTFSSGKNIIIGQLNTSKSYSVFSTTSNTREALSFIFYLPLTVLAWQRINFGSVVVIVGSCEEWLSDDLLKHVLQQLINLQAVVVFIKGRPENDVMLSQVSRLFVANTLLERFAEAGGVYLLTSDADLWPLNRETYTLTPGKSILSLNSECCVPFKHQGEVFKMLPLSNVGMNISMWIDTMTKFNLAPSSAEEILLYMLKEFGTIASRPVSKGENTGWYMDQMTVSMAISRQHHKNNNSIKYVPRNTNVDRIDKHMLGGRVQVEDKIDTHLPGQAFRKETFQGVKKVLELMYGKYSVSLKFCTEYFLVFRDLMANVKVDK